MDIYPIMKFIHIISDITLFIGVGAQLLCHLSLRRATHYEQARLLLGLITISDRIGVTGALLTIASGVYMAATVWGFQVGWIIVALGSIALIIGPVIRGVVEPRNKALIKAAKSGDSGPLPESFKTLAQNPILSAGVLTNMAVVVGIVFLMTTKPALAGAIAAMAVALVLALTADACLWLITRNRSTDHKTGGEAVVQ